MYLFILSLNVIILHYLYVYVCLFIYLFSLHSLICIPSESECYRGGGDGDIYQSKHVYAVSCIKKKSDSALFKQLWNVIIKMIKEC